VTHLRQITTCTAPAEFVAIRHSQRKGRAHEYTLHICQRHRWLTGPDHWGWGRASHRLDTPAGRCGTVADHRPFAAVLESHIRTWLGMGEPVMGDRPMVFASWAEELRYHHQDKLRWHSNSPQYQGVLVALGHAVQLTDLLDTGDVDQSTAEAQILAALAIAETLDAQQRGA
jgi:hypothetical protein